MSPAHTDLPTAPDESSPNLLTRTWRTTDQLARLLNIDPSTLRRWRTARTPQGPPFVRLSERVVMYSDHDVENWLRHHRTAPDTTA